MIKIFKSLVFDLSDQMEQQVPAAHQRELLCGQIAHMGEEGDQELHLDEPIHLAMAIHQQDLLKSLHRECFGLQRGDPID
jgi:hypothetical protein